MVLILYVRTCMTKIGFSTEQELKLSLVFVVCASDEQFKKYRVFFHDKTERTSFQANPDVLLS